MKWMSTLLATLTVVVVSFGAVSCSKEEPQGPAEQAGESVDNAMKDIGKNLEKAGQEMQDTAEGNDQQNDN